MSRMNFTTKPRLTQVAMPEHFREAEAPNMFLYGERARVPRNTLVRKIFEELVPETRCTCHATTPGPLVQAGFRRSQAEDQPVVYPSLSELHAAGLDHSCVGRRCRESTRSSHPAMPIYVRTPRADTASRSASAKTAPGPHHQLLQDDIASDSANMYRLAGYRAGSLSRPHSKSYCLATSQVHSLSGKDQLWGAKCEAKHRSKIPAFHCDIEPFPLPSVKQMTMALVWRCHVVRYINAALHRRSHWLIVSPFRASANRTRWPTFVVAITTVSPRSEAMAACPARITSPSRALSSAVG